MRVGDADPSSRLDVTSVVGLNAVKPSEVFGRDKSENIFMA